MKNYLIHIQMHDHTHEELTDCSIAIDTFLITDTETRQLLYRGGSEQTYLWEYLVSSKKPAHVIRRILDGNRLAEDGRETPFNQTHFRKGDKLLVIELSNEFDETGLIDIRTWLNHRSA